MVDGRRHSGKGNHPVTGGRRAGKWLVAAALLTIILVLAGCGRGARGGEAPTPAVPAADVTGAPEPAAGDSRPTATREPTPTVAPVAISEPLRAQAADQQPSEIRLGWLLSATDVYLLPDAASEVLGQLDAGQLAIVTGSSGDWFEIVYGEGRRGHAWIPQASVSFERSSEAVTTRTPAAAAAPTAAVTAEATPAADVQMGTVLAPQLNVRSGPGTTNAVVGRLNRNDRVEIVDRQSGWLQIRFADAAEGTGWVSGGFVAVDGEAAPATPIPTRTSLQGTLAFQERTGGNIYLMNADGSNLRRLTNGIDPALSPDGSQVAFTRWDEPRGLFVVNVDGTGERRLIGENLIKNPTWSPDGTRISFNQQRGGREAMSITIPGGPTFKIPESPAWRLGVINVDGSGRDNVTDQSHSFNPSWDSRGVIYSGDGGLHITVPGGDSRPFFSTRNQIRNPSWAPDGSVVVATMEFHDHWEVVLVSADGGSFRRLTENSQKTNSVAPTWSPAGDSILFLTDRRGRWEVWIMNADGSNQRPFASQALAGVDFRYDFAAEHVIDWVP